MNDLTPTPAAASPRPGAANRVLALRAAAGIATVGVLAALAPLIWAAVSAGAGLLALGALVAAGVAALQALPWLGQKWENKLLALRKKEARENPIEQLQNFLLQKRQRVHAFKAAVAAIGAQIKGLEDMIEDRKKKKPGYDASKQERSVRAMRDAHALMVRKYESAERALDELSDRIEDKKFEWSFGQAGQMALRSLNSTGGQALLDEMLADEAFASVRDNFNQVFAEMELEATRLSNDRQMTFDGGMTLDLSAIDIRQLERSGG